MKTKSKYLLGFLALLTVVVGIVMYGSTTENFFGMVRYSKSIKSPSVSTAVKASDLMPISENSFVKDLTSQTFKNVEFKTSWDPGKYREESDKALIKIYPFQSMKYVEDIKDIIFTPFKKWRNAGIKGVGVVASVDYSRQNHDHLLMGTAASGIYRSLNFGQNWTKLDDFPTYIINRVAVDPNDDNHYLVIADWLYLYESFDKGNSWQLNTYIDSLKTGGLDLQWNGNTIFIRAGKNAKVSQNNGQNWSSHILPFGANGYVRIKNSGNGAAIAPSDDDGALDNNFYVTSNYGQTWTQKLISESNNIISAFDISTNGQNIVVARYNDEVREISFVKSNDGGNNWNYATPPNQGYTTFWPQDLLMDEANPDHFEIFVYMKSGSFFTTYNGGQTLLLGAYTINEIDSIPIRRTESNEAYVVAPLDLRFNHMVKIVEEIPSGRIDLGDQIKTSLVNEDVFKEIAPIKNAETAIDIFEAEYKPPTIKIEKFLLPTDQGLFVYDKSLKKMSNIAKDVYLGDTGHIVVTSCPRVYAGLWHVGYFFIDSDASVWGYTNSEKGGATAGEDLGCNTPIMYSQGMYSPDGITVDMDVSYWIWNTLAISSIGSTLFHYYDGWWYVEISHDLFRLNIPNRQVEQIQLPVYNIFHAFNIEEGPNPNYWLLTQTGTTLSIWNSQDLQNWNLYKELNNFQYFLYEETTQVNNESQTRRTTFRANNIEVNGSQILLSNGFSLAVSNDGGNTWHQNFLYGFSSNIVRDDKGRLFVGIRNSRITAQFLTGKQNSGVWYSVNHGITWNLLESETEKSQIESLALDENSNILYAATWGESLLQFHLNDYNLPEPPKVHEGAFDDEFQPVLSVLRDLE